MDIEQRKYVGNTQQLYSARVVRFQEGRADGMKAIIVKNGSLEFTVMADKCLDVAELSYKGENISFLTKPGLQGRNQYDTNGPEAQHSIMAGAFFTCGLQNTGGPCNAGGVDYAMHGRLRTTPCEHLCVDTLEENGKTFIKISGEMRDSMLFGRNLQFRRCITTEVGSSSIHIHDEVVNENYQSEPFCLLYHCNTGYPFLDESCYMILDSKSIRSQTEYAEKNKEKWNTMEAPTSDPSIEEMVYMHDVEPMNDGSSQATIVNPNKNLAYRLKWNKNQLKNFMEWKSTISGDYVWAVEPCNSTFEGRKVMEEKNLLEVLEPFEKRCFDIDISLLEDFTD
jgi:hypothetical protein